MDRAVGGTQAQAPKVKDGDHPVTQQDLEELVQGARLPVVDRAPYDASLGSTIFPRRWRGHHPLLSPEQGVPEL